MKSKMNLVFWAIVAIESIALMVFISMDMADTHGNHDGGRSMGRFFFIIVPGAILALAVVLYVFVQSAAVRVVALLIVASPALIYASMKAHDYYLDYKTGQSELGHGYFSTSTMDAMAVAVVKADIATIRKLAPKVDINTVGSTGVTLLWLAVDNAFTSAKSLPDDTRLTLVKTLLELGAKADVEYTTPSHVNPALQTALASQDLAVAKALLDAGANPDARDNTGTPLIFSARLAGFRLLAERGANLNATSGGTPLSVSLATDNQWDSLLCLIERGADVSRPYTAEDPRTAASFVATAIENARRDQREPAPLLLRLAAQLKR